MAWLKVIFRLDEIKKALALVPLLGLRRHTGGYPEGFDVYCAFELGGDSIEGARFVLYLSPKAAFNCSDLYQSFVTEECAKPDLEGQYVANALRHPSQADYESDQTQ
jgi:hypothetical protein